MSDPYPRYVVREITGYALRHGSQPPSTSVWVADTWDCWREVATFYAVDRSFAGQERLVARRTHAETLCAELNAEHDAWLACA